MVRALLRLYSHTASSKGFLLHQLGLGAVSGLAGLGRRAGLGESDRTGALPRQTGRPTVLSCAYSIRPLILLGARNILITANHKFDPSSHSSRISLWLC